jgi:hypothetical protein
MNTIKTVAITIASVIFLLNSTLSFSNDTVTKNVTNHENSICQDCGEDKLSALENLKEFFSINNIVTPKKENPLKKYLRQPSPISHDIANIPHFDEDRGKEIIFFYTLFKF